MVMIYNNVNLYRTVQLSAVKTVNFITYILLQ